MSAEGSQGKPYRKLGELLVAAGVIDELQLKSALGHQRQWGGRIGHILLDLHFIDDLTLARTLAEQLGLEMIGLRTAPLDLAVVRFLPQALAERLLVFPVSFTPDAETGGILTVAFSDPTNLAGLDEVRFQTGKVVIPAVATESEVAWAIRRFYYGEEDTEPLSPPAIEAPARDREGLFGDGSQMLSGPEEEELAELEPIPSDSQVAENPLILAKAAEAAEGRPPGPDAMGAFFADEHASVPMQLQEIDLTAVPAATDLGIDLSAEVSARHPTRPDFLNPLLADAAEPGSEAPTGTGPAVAAELDAAFERTFALDGTEAIAAGTSPDAPSLLMEAQPPAGLSGQALQALIRILVRKGLVSEIEILDELQAELSSGQPPMGDNPLRR
jgi:Type II secretion system (T2SS), protein E, N-terminal domain